MYRSRVDKEKRILFIEIAEFISNEETLEATKDFWIKIASLGRDSYIICDITKFKSGNKVSFVLLQKVMKLVESYEPRAVIRVISAYSGAMVFDKAYKKTRVNYKLFRVDSQERALEVIDTLNQIPPIFKEPPS